MDEAATTEEDVEEDMVKMASHLSMTFALNKTAIDNLTDVTTAGVVVMVKTTAETTTATPVLDTVREEFLFKTEGIMLCFSKLFKSHTSLQLRKRH